MATPHSAPRRCVSLLVMLFAAVASGGCKPKCDQKMLAEYMPKVRAADPYDQPAAGAALVAEACAKALPEPWRRGFEASGSVNPLDRPTVLTSALFGDDEDLGKRLCTSGKGSLLDAFKGGHVSAARRKVFETCGLGTAGVFNADEYSILDAAPEAALATYDWLMSHGVGKDDARTLARWISGVDDPSIRNPPPREPPPETDGGR